MCELTQISRIVHSHEWTSPAEWAVAVDALADLTDSEIEQLTTAAARSPHA